MAKYNKEFINKYKDMPAKQLEKIYSDMINEDRKIVSSKENEIMDAIKWYDTPLHYFEQEQQKDIIEEYLFIKTKTVRNLKVVPQHDDITILDMIEVLTKNDKDDTNKKLLKDFFYKTKFKNENDRIGFYLWLCSKPQRYQNFLIDLNCPDVNFENLKTKYRCDIKHVQKKAD